MLRISARRSWLLGGDLNTASEEPLGRLLWVNTILSLCGTLCGSVITTLAVTFESRSGTTIVRPMSMGGCEQDTCFGELPSRTHALLSSWNASPCPLLHTHIPFKTKL